MHHNVIYEHCSRNLYDANSFPWVQWKLFSSLLCAFVDDCTTKQIYVTKYLRYSSECESHCVTLRISRFRFNRKWYLHVCLKSEWSKDKYYDLYKRFFYYSDVFWLYHRIWIQNSQNLKTQYGPPSILGEYT